ncbi:hypothetical protein [Williamsia sp.]|uniref:hypothetical protein n=1 Tax=Williamsia sp. TaxID=1872085 RepID=UPI002F93665E
MGQWVVLPFAATPADVAELRRSLRDDMKAEPRLVGHATTLGKSRIFTHLLAEGALPGQVRAGLAQLCVAHRVLVRLSAEDVDLFWAATGLTSPPVTVADLSRILKSNRKAIERRLNSIDAKVAELLRTRALPLPSAAVRSPTAAENVVALSSDAALTSTPRSVSAIKAYAERLRTPFNTVLDGLPAPPRSAKDERYRDSLRVPARLETLAYDPPLLGTAYSLDPEDGDPAKALDDLERAARDGGSAQRSELIARVARLIPDAHVLGVASRLRFLELAFGITRDAENLRALRFAMAWESESAQLEDTDAREFALMSARAGRAHVLQMFGHLDLASSQYRRAAAPHLSKDHKSDLPIAHVERLNDILGQIAYTESLRCGNMAAAMKALDQMHRLEELVAPSLEAEFTRLRRTFEVRLVLTTSGSTLRPRRDIAAHDHSLLEASREEFFSVAARHAEPNRLLSAADLRVLWAIRERDIVTVEQSLAEFSDVSDGMRGYANLSHRTQTRISTAIALWQPLRDVQPVQGIEDPWREPGLIPKRATGLMVYPKRDR